MAGYKRFIAATLVTAALAAPALGSAAAGQAAPYVTAPALSVSTTGPCRSAPLTVVGTGFVPGSTVTLTLAGVASLGSVTVRANGGFTLTVILPEVTGRHLLIAAGPAAQGNPNTAEATLDLRNCLPFVPVTG